MRGGVEGWEALARGAEEHLTIEFVTSERDQLVNTYGTVRLQKAVAAGEQLQ